MKEKRRSVVGYCRVKTNAKTVEGKHSQVWKIKWFTNALYHLLEKEDIKGEQNGGYCKLPETMVPSFFSSTPRLFNRQGTFSLNMKDRFHQRALYMKGKLLICIPKVGGAFLLHGCLEWLKNLLENGWGRLYSKNWGT